MKKKKVWRYYCEFCGKGGCSAGSMAKHEKRCTLNPNRECGFHIGLKIIDEPQTSLDELRTILRNGCTHAESKSIPQNIDVLDILDSYIETFAECQDGLLDTLMDAANGCPACVLAAIRQENATRTPDDQIIFEGFRYSHEVEKAFEAAHDRWNRENEHDAIYS